MILVDFACPNCDLIFEQLVDSSIQFFNCPKCHMAARRIITKSNNHPNEDAPWIRSVLEVVDKESNKPHIVEFLKHPNRTNYKKWMKGEGLRHLEPGEKPQKPKVDEVKITEEVFKKYQKRSRLEV